MKGERIHLLEKLDLAGGSCDGRRGCDQRASLCAAAAKWTTILRVMWDTFRDVPSIETPGVSVLDEYYWLNKA